jgi:hypothetical protein
MTSTVTMEVNEDRADITKKAAARKNSIDDAIKRTIPVVDAEQAVSFWPRGSVHAGMNILCFVAPESPLADYQAKCSVSHL